MIEKITQFEKGLAAEDKVKTAFRKIKRSRFNIGIFLFLCWRAKKEGWRIEGKW